MNAWLVIGSHSRYLCNLLFMRRILPAIVALLLTTTWFAVWTFAHFERVAGRLWMVLPLLLVAGFLPTTMVSHRFRAQWLGALNVASGISVGFLSYFVLAAVVCWGAAGLSAATGHHLEGQGMATWAFGAAAVVGLYALFSAYWVRITRVTIRLPNLPSFWNGRTIALVSDIHLGNFRGPAFSRHVVSRLMSLQPECILIGGDMFDGVKIDVNRAARPWSALSAPSGVYFVGGNHDDYGGRTSYFDALRQVGMRVLDNEKVEISGVQLIGVHDRETHSPEVFRSILEKARIDSSRASILLAHRPENLSVPEEAGINLQLSGHTHRGQFWPWTLVARRVHRDFAYGLNRFGRMAVFTSSGVGTWGPPFRLGTRSELVLVRLESK
jgi:predicted MPP superfamily phosphohydrolase